MIVDHEGDHWRVRHVLLIVALLLWMMTMMRKMSYYYLYVMVTMMVYANWTMMIRCVADLMMVLVMMAY